MQSGAVEVVHGGYFRVEIHPGFVRKYPKDETITPPRLAEIVDAQNYLAQRVRGCLPATLHGGYMEMEIPPGRCAREYKKPYYREHILPIAKAIVREIRRHGYRLRDLSKENVFWEEATRRVWIIDYHDIEQMNEPETQP